LYQKLLKSDNWFLSYSRKCWGCFFETQCSLFNTYLYHCAYTLQMHISG